MRQEYEWEISQESRIIYMIGNKEVLVYIREQAPMVPFSDETVQFLEALSGKLRKRTEIRRMPEVAAFAFWCRNAHLRQLAAEYGSCEEKRIGRGVSLHFAPSNMPVLFAFTMAAGLLAGDSVIVRLSQKSSEQETVIITALRELLGEKFSQFRERIVLCRYEHNREITDALSAICDVRVIWGSDASVTEIRRSPLPPRAVELSFASRSSAAVLCAEAVNQTEEIDLLIHDFYNDTYLNDQNACSSPQIIYWLGTQCEVEKAKKRFWKALGEELERREYQVPAAIAVKKLDSAMMLAAVFENATILRDTNRLVRVCVPKLQREMWDYTAPGGFFIECDGEKTDGLADILTERCQTLCVYGIEAEILKEDLFSRRVSGVDRIVPAGHALDFSLTWDGFDLIETMSRRISSRW